MITAIILLLINLSMASKSKYFLNDRLMNDYMDFILLKKGHETTVNDEEFFPVKSIPSKTGFPDYDTLKDEIIQRYLEPNIDEKINNLEETTLN